MKTYVLIVSPKFPKKHLRSGEKTEFKYKINSGLKIHTLRGNYELWRKRFDEIEKGNAFLSLREWSGLPYRSKQIEFLRLDKSYGIGIEKLIYGETDCPNLAINDGLTQKDFTEWFKDADKNKPLAIIHFTRFRYKLNF